MKKFLAAAVLVINLFFMSISHAEIQTYEGTDEYIMCEFETIDIAKQRARQKAESNVQEKAGAYISSYSETKNFELDADEIVSIACGILKVVDVQYDVTSLDDEKGFSIRAIVKANIETDDVNKWLEKSAREKSMIVIQNKELQKAIADQDETINQLKEQIKNLTAEGKLNGKREREKITQKVAAEDKMFLANQKLEEAQKNFYHHNYEETIKLCDESIAIQPTAQAYCERGGAYGVLRNFNKTVEDCTQAIKLDPNYAMAYTNRGAAYGNLDNYQQAMADINKAIQCDPTLALAYNNRGALYLMAGNVNQAFRDADKAIELNPKLDLAYMIRGTCYQIMGNLPEAQADFEKAKELGYEG